MNFLTGIDETKARLNACIWHEVLPWTHFVFVIGSSIWARKESQSCIFYTNTDKKKWRKNLYARGKIASSISAVRSGSAQTSATRDRCICRSLPLNYVRNKPQANYRTPCHTSWGRG